ncbi:tetraacyldisaccharide 4'-kinase [Thauera linaloolentis]|uniref:Tetraacyldisaccharide 4'-kinase n=1 Tax=Thauera linaloolentis (strain DSM 12138 / JCM 21573 / CCUG 41526 / CIP 105981 / IAM 15112 / NBRC 102519 / 47Lol) TaxID=1123367 RepID=N6Y7E2_THAL4|nr:tetraacyldisaccharide 4'-kinase [Thauera linaloolentis]ENO87490.1 tetraacyldisaccharide 4'-kinase [Thauera linaloolentis 47Lol = DSM 12138]MCM8565545.1 tetraacyldisaccharide 4'-kinase [Thauera linaloolentis]
MAAQAPAFWRRRGLPAWLLQPLSWLFGALARRRRRRTRPERLPVPVIVVGNIAVGGSGKTPVVQWLVLRLRAAGYRPGVVSRGHGGRVEGVAEVPADGDPAVHGDEPVLLAGTCACPVVVGRDRPAAARELLRLHPACDVIVADDGMQHYRLGRDVEIVVLDPATLGNGLLLPAGPLREPLARLAEVDAVIAHGGLSPALRAAIGGVPVFPMHLQGSALRALRDPARTLALEALRGCRVHALAGIGRPQRFFDQLEAAGLVVLRHPFPDHHDFSPSDLVFAEPAPILMTAKDAVKCKAFAPDDCWEFPVEAQIGSGAAERILEKLKNGRTPA